jgi:hypothetical protein
MEQRNDDEKYLKVRAFAEKIYNDIVNDDSEAAKLDRESYLEGFVLGYILYEENLKVLLNRSIDLVMNSINK